MWKQILDEHGYQTMILVPTEREVVPYPTYALAVAGLAKRTTPCRVLITADEVNNAGAFGKYDYDGTQLIEDIL
ncbi:hypothetical protein [Fibrella forsythiae]|uniref:Uncharacterized protein n=1 Tax=Fibrella forsythiae TaxID=2817061 RepID=A0ABS3JAI8_9BACT|nr:hypothetical protein [Fibrella forsythiae]MBO0947014.1 hypothetical protein [Fibrella forsythiae]